MAKKNNFRKTNSAKRFDLGGEKERDLDLEKEKTKFLKKENENASYNALNQKLLSNSNITQTPPIILNKIGAHNSFLSVVIHSIWHLSSFRNFILTEQNQSINKEGKYRLLYE